MIDVLASLDATCVLIAVPRAHHLDLVLVRPSDPAHSWWTSDLDHGRVLWASRAIDAADRQLLIARLALVPNPNHVKNCEALGIKPYAPVYAKDADDKLRPPTYYEDQVRPAPEPVPYVHEVDAQPLPLATRNPGRVVARLMKALDETAPTIDAPVTLNEDASDYHERMARRFMQEGK